MLKVTKNAEQYFNVMTDLGCFTMCGAPQGFVNTPGISTERLVQEVSSPPDCFAPPALGPRQWLDDSLLYSDTILIDFLRGLERFL